MKSDEIAFLGFLLSLSIAVVTVTYFIAQLKKEIEILKAKLDEQVLKHNELQVRYKNRGERFIKAFRALKEYCVKTTLIVEDNQENIEKILSELSYLFEATRIKKPSTKFKKSKLPDFDTLNELDNLEQEFIELQTILK